MYFLFKIVFIYSLTILDIILSKKLSWSDVDGINSKNLNECGRCKVLTESFSHWFDKTSRGKYEGGDAAWEEEKLKSYARSEIRLVEIQEGLCSELKKNQDACYAVAEDAELALEKWWFHDDLNGVDLYTWLCIENLHHCCPKNHFGVNCESCPLDKNNKLCSGHGRCNGEGTRNGNGSCICYQGYAGKFCEDCDKNFFSSASDDCQPCHLSCNGCTANGAAGCITCNSGWQMENGICVDVDECSDPSLCKQNQYCVNKEGSHVCKNCDKSCNSCIGAGVTNCSSCAIDSMLWSGMCVGRQLKQELINYTLQRMALYFGLLVTTLFISRTYRLLGSLIIIVLAIYIYFSEKSAKMTVFDIISNLYF